MMPSPGKKQLFETTLVDPQGLTRHFQTTYIPDVVDGEVHGIYVQVTDITEHAEAERTRDEAMRLFQISMDNAPIGQAIVNMSAQCLYVNPALCAMFGYTPAELTGADLRQFIHPDDLATAEADFALLKSRSQPHVASELRLFRRDGTTIWCSAMQ